jgi:hypothetical protein
MMIKSNKFDYMYVFIYLYNILISYLEQALNTLFGKIIFFSK